MEVKTRLKRFRASIEIFLQGFSRIVYVHVLHYAYIASMAHINMEISLIFTTSTV